MKYFFILGNNPTLSFAEIASVLNLKPEQILFLSEESLIVDIEDSLEVEKLIRRLGGTIKIGEIKFQVSDLKYQKLVELIEVKNSEGKFNFGISYYGKNKLKNEKSLAMEIKRTLKEKEVSSRWVTSKEKTLSSVVVEQNKLITDKGIEIVIMNNYGPSSPKGFAEAGQFYIGKTLVVQPFKELSKRDYGRPGRDDKSGMLPPKLAQIMLNLTGGNSKDILLDPFCGSGTILTEAMLMSYEKLIGCDKSEKAITDTKKNIEWTKEYGQLSDVNCQMFQIDVSSLSGKIKLSSVDAIVTEPYLGPSRIRRDRNSIEKVVKELEQLYHQAILQFEKVLKPSGRIVMIWPVLIVDNNEKIYLNTRNILKGSSFQKINSIEEFKNKTLQLTNRQTFLYGREAQQVWREIVVLGK